MHTIKNIILCGGSALLTLSCASSLNSKSPNRVKQLSMSSKDRGVAERVFSLVNAERRRNGKKAMRPHAGIIKLAQQNSNRLAADPSSAAHLGSQNRSEFAFLKYNVENLSEVEYSVPSGVSDPAVYALNAWKKSPEHRAHILQSWDVTGVGAKTDSNGKTHITMCMGASPSGVPRSVSPVGWQ